MTLFQLLWFDELAHDKHKSCIFWAKYSEKMALSYRWHWHGWSIKAWTNFGRTEKWLLIKLNSTISMSFRSLTVFFYIQHRKTLPARIKCSLFMFFFIRGAIKGGLLTRSTKKTFIIPFSLLVPLNMNIPIFMM